MLNRFRPKGAATILLAVSCLGLGAASCSSDSPDEPTTTQAERSSTTTTSTTTTSTTTTTSSTTTTTAAPPPPPTTAPPVYSPATVQDLAAALEEIIATGNYAALSSFTTPEAAEQIQTAANQVAAVTPIEALLVADDTECYLGSSGYGVCPLLINGGEAGSPGHLEIQYHEGGPTTLEIVAAALAPA